ncbi:GTP-dependent dephospho-CoA kinase family protein [Methanocaldococcus sp.]|uniref:GTP-dependent dephospho-CoA kinase family protein n=1 Tax=Methanocaldococcus sp. TaxID=2152917 RepID=UPI002625966C|nr:GTP-dependent dephospho-CoA kinase family protein [Methanocaldococcus sp.]MCQ6254593.1 GTP-dependent dephospho-CoA kinase family protein [Methanocaldococcus sp.]
MLILPENLREKLKKPFGKVYKTLPNIDGDIVTVGDIVTKTVIENNIIPKLSIFDLKTQRTIPIKINHNFKKIIKIKNPPGCISDEAIESIKYLSTINDKDIALLVDGEEDLLTLIVIKYFPLGTYVLYGLPNKGMVVIKINEKIKKEIENLLKQFIRVNKK